MNGLHSVLPAGALVVESYLRAQGSAAQVSLLPDSTATAKDAALAVGAEVWAIGKSIVFIGDSGLVVAVVPGDESVDVGALRQRIGDRSLRKASAKEVKDATGFPIGGVSPFGLPSYIRVVVDEKLATLDLCWVAAGHPRAVAKMSGIEVISLSRADVYSLSTVSGNSI